jgi:glutamate 5-kinase
MESKINVAKGAASKDIVTYIANGKREDVIIDIVHGKDVGTRIYKEEE